MGRIIHLPKLTALTVALAATAPTAQATSTTCPTVNGNTSTQVTWSSGDCVVAASIVVPGTTGLVASGTLGTLTNSGTITGYHYGMSNSGSIAVLNNTIGGTISASGGNSAGLVNSGTIGTLTNSGTITSSFSNNGNGIYNNAGTINTLTNAGVINSVNSGIFNGGGTIGTLTNLNIIAGNRWGITNGASIIVLNNASGATISGATSGINNASSGTIGTLTNSGTISSNTYGISNSGSITLLNNTIGGTIVSAEIGIVNSGTIGTLTNSGTISGGNTGIVNRATIGTLINSGTIEGARYGIYLGVADPTGALINSGTITGASDAIFNAASSPLGPITNSGVIAGNITNASSNALIINGGSGATFGTLTGFASGSIGTIMNTQSNLTFGTGNLLLNDTVNVGSNTLNNSAATLQVNNAIAINGNYNQGAAATLQIGVANGAVAGGAIGSDSGYGRLVVSGSATIASGSSVNLKPLTTYGFAVGQRFVVVDASTPGTNYNEGSLNYSASSFDGVLSGTDVTADGRSDLVVTLVSAAPTPTQPPSPFTVPATVPATVPNAVSALGGLLSYSGVSPGLLNLFDAADVLAAGSSTAAINRAGVQLAPVQQAASTGAAAAPTLDVLNVVAAHADSLRVAQADGIGSGVATGEGAPAWSAWGQAFGGHASQNERDQVPGYSANYSGLLLGVDKSINDRWRAGGVFSYTNTAINDEGDAAGDSTRVNSYGFIGYASYTGQPWYVNLSGGVVQQDYTTNRQVNFTGFAGNANGQFSGQQYVARAEAGYPLPLGPATLTPLASLTYSNLQQNGYTESGGNGAALTVGSGHSASVRSALGVKLEEGFATTYGVLVPDIRLQWLHEYDNAQQVTGASFAADPTGQTAFTTVGASPVSNVADVTLGVTLLRANNLSLTMRYELQAGGGFVSQTGSLRLRQMF